MAYRIRPARPDELARLRDLEHESVQRFNEGYGLDDVPEDLTPLDELVEAHGRGHVWVVEAADGELAGFAYGTPLDGSFHLEEIDVVPRHGRRGVGTALLEAVCREAADAGFAAVTLTTFRHVPWNAPFYARRGFRILAAGELTPGLEWAFDDEARRGLPIASRVVMRRDLAGD